MRGPYRTIEDVLRSPWAATERPREGQATDRVLRSTRLEDSIYADLKDGYTCWEQTEQEAVIGTPRRSRGFFLYGQSPMLPAGASRRASTV